MISYSRYGNLSIRLCALGMSGFIFSGGAMAQVPGIPMPGTTTPQSSSNSTVLTGQIRTDIAPAEKLLSQGRYSEAEETFREFLVNNPQDLQATLGLGIALAKQFKLDGADELFDRVLMSDPNNALAFAGKATVILNRLQSSAGIVRSNRDVTLKQAEEYAQRAFTLAPANAETHYTLGQVLKEEGRTDEAASEFRTAVQLDPNHSYAFSSLGSIKLDQNNLIEAAGNFQRAIALNSGNSTAHYGLGATFLKQGLYDDAIKELNIALYQFPNSWPTHMAMGEAYDKQGNTVAALKEYQLSTLIKPENADPYLRIANIRAERGDQELALAELRSALTQMPYNLDVRMQIADTCLKLEKADDAIQGYRTILQMSPNNTVAIKGLSQALYLKAQKAAVGALLASNDYDAALKTLDEAIKLSPDDMELRLAQAKLTSLAGGHPDLSKMGEPKSDGERIAYAEAAMAQGDFQKASDLLQQVINSQTDSKQAFAVADIALMIKDLDNAEAAYKKAVSLSGAADRGQRGLDQIAQLRKSANADVVAGNELFNKKLYDSAIERYRHAIATNMKLADARLGLARTLEKMPKASASMLAESAQQYQYYLLLKTDFPEKDREKLMSQIEKLKEKSAKLAEKESRGKHS